MLVKGFRILQTSANNVHIAKIKKIDGDRQIVFSEVYAPYTVDTYGDMMLPEDLERAAHNFLRKNDLTKVIDTNHDLVPNGSIPVESFIARKGDPDFTEGAWVLGVKINDPLLWDKVKDGTLNGYSMYGLSKRVPSIVEVEVAPATLGITELTDGHNHYFFVELDADGRVLSGRTSLDNGHAHDIRAGTATEATFGHSHRYFM